ncbi:MAG: MarR family winged helix-turn-helix transcriptional regulator [Bacillota bacterium]|nr:MarR family winged helix-turn-helix transcriptional regulator [Bacillota bacterium]
MREYPRIGIYIKTLLHQMEHRRTEALRDIGLTSSQTDVLMFIAASPQGKICQRDVEQFFHLSNPTVTGILWRLEKKGFIVRAIDPSDGRRKTVIPTQQAKKSLTMMGDLCAEIEEQLLAPLDEAERETLGRLLEKILDSAFRNGAKNSQQEK